MISEKTRRCQQELDTYVVMFGDNGWGLGSDYQYWQKKAALAESKLADLENLYPSLTAADLEEFSEFIQEDIVGNANEAAGQGRFRLSDLYNDLASHAKTMLRQVR